MIILNQNIEYSNWLKELKTTIQKRQLKAAVAVNNEIIMLYWELGKEIVQKQENAKWGSGFIDQLSKDLKEAFPEMSGFSSGNLRYARMFYLFYSPSPLICEQLVRKLDNYDNQPSIISEQAVRKLEKSVSFNNTISEQVVPILEHNIFKIPWGHHILILKKIKKLDEALFYINQTVENNWSRSILEYQIESNLFLRQGKAITNFKNTMPEIESDLATALLKDPYNFQFLQLEKHAKEKDLERKLIEHITHFLLELGKGFAYMGKQYLLKVGQKEYRTDLLFYHTKLKRYIIIELKITEFEPEFIGKLNFYISAINEFVKEDNDQATIGILLCKNKDNYEVEFALRDVNKPIGVSEYKYTELPVELQNSLPSKEQLDNEIKKIMEKE
jgi:predicted nuclease of restriction endonuclease-like (RecB) superfamily